MDINSIRPLNPSYPPDNSGKVNKKDSDQPIEKQESAKDNDMESSKSSKGGRRNLKLLGQLENRLRQITNKNSDSSKVTDAQQRFEQLEDKIEDLLKTKLSPEAFARFEEIEDKLFGGHDDDDVGTSPPPSTSPPSTSPPPTASAPAPSTDPGSTGGPSVSAPAPSTDPGSTGVSPSVSVPAPSTIITRPGGGVPAASSPAPSTNPSPSSIITRPGGGIPAVSTPPSPSSIIIGGGSGLPTVSVPPSP